MAKYSSRTEMEKEGSNFKPLKAGSYICKLDKIEVKNKKNFHGEMVDMVTMQFPVYESNARKPQVLTTDGEEVKPLTRKFFFDIEKLTMGFRDNFTVPSKLRALVAVLLNEDPFGEIDGPDQLDADSVVKFLKEYEGNYIVVNVNYAEKDGKGRNKIVDFLPAPDDFEADEVVEAQAVQREKERLAKDGDAPKKSKAQVKVENEDEVELDEDEDTPEEKPTKKTRKALF